MDYYEKELKDSAKCQHMTWQKHKKDLEEIEKPAIPSFINGKWNKKLYKDSVYVDNEKIVLNDEQIKEVKQYIDDFEDYTKKINVL